MNKNSTKGFTLIELLVVIAIIGILAALVLVALGSARTKAQDARIQSDVSQLRTIAEVIYDNNSSSYAKVATCFAGTAADCGDQAASVSALTSDISTANGGTAAASNSSDAAFCVSALMNNAKYMCADSAGTTTTSASSDPCDATNYNC